MAEPVRRVPTPFLVVAALLLPACRVPRLVSPHFVLDGDEAILGVMARHLSAGADLPVFFYGQTYGFSTLEAVAGAAGLTLAGSREIGLPLAMLALWLVGLALWRNAFRALSGEAAWSLVLTVLLGLLPVWIVWSLKARGGYVTAFVLAGGAAWLLSRSRITPAGAFGAGVLLGATLQSQPLWVPGLLPLAALAVLVARSRSVGAGAWTASALLAGLLVAAGAIGVAGGQGTTAWEPAVLLTLRPDHLLDLPGLLYRLFGGFFLLGESWRPPAVVGAVALAATATFFLVLVRAGLDALRRTDRTLALLALSPLLAVAPVALLSDVQPRYLLPASVYVFLPVARMVALRRPSFERRDLRAVGALVAVLAVASVQTGSLRTHAAGTGSDVEEELRGLVATLRANGVEAAFTLDGLLQWQLALYGGETVAVRSRRAVDRYPPFVARADSVLARGGRVALVAPIGAEPFLRSTEIGPALRRVGSDYVVLPDPPRALLVLMGFRFREPGPAGADPIGADGAHGPRETPASAAPRGSAGPRRMPP